VGEISESFFRAKHRTQ